MRNKHILFVIIVTCLSTVENRINAQISAFDEDRRGSLYFGVGTGLYTNYGSSTLHVAQQSLNNNVQFNSLTASTTGTNSSFSPLQLNYRLGYFFSYAQIWGFELAWDGDPYYIKDGQQTSVSGTVDGTKTNTNTTFSSANGLKYSLQGADLMQLNLVRRFGIFWGSTHKVRIDAFVKAGGGPAMPKTNATLFNETTSPKLGLAGFDADFEASLRVTLFRFGYLDIGAKYAYASLNNITIADGTATQKFSVLGVVASIGFTLPTTHDHPWFQKGEKKHRVITIKQMYPTDKN